MFDRILVGFDGSRGSRRACQVATEIAVRFHSALTLLVVRGTPRSGSDPYLEGLVPVGDDGRALTSVVEEIREKALARGAGRVDQVFLSGDVLKTLLEWVHAHPQDLIVVGSRGLSRGSRLLLGSVSSGLVNEAPCPVLVVRPHRDGRGRDSGP